MENNKLVIISTKVSKNYGAGHLKRSINIAKELLPFSYPIIFVNNDKNGIRELEKSGIKYVVIKSKKDEIKLLDSISYDILLVDKRETSFYKNRRGITVGIDNYGSDTDYFDFTISALPYEKEFNVNFKGIEYLVLDSKIFEIRKSKNRDIKNILVTFGGSDPKDLSSLIVHILEEISNNFNVKIILGPLYSGKINKDRLPPNFTIQEFKESLYDYIQWADIVITSFGITAIESLVAERPVFLINPTDYHNRLANILKVSSFLGDYKNFDNIKAAIIKFIKSPFIPVLKLPTSNSSFVGLIKRFLSGNKELCPICNSYVNRITVFRDGFNNIFFCKKDKIIFRNSDYSSDKKYGPDYFITSYKSQYGKTYEEDRPNIDRLNKRRIKIIKKILKNVARPKLFEAGSALGFFLDLARSEGFIVKGVEISKYATDYSKNILKLDVVNSSFFDFNFDYKYYDVITMWYFIEHIKELDNLILKVKSGLKKNGILAISTPNCYGITGRKNIKNYSSKIPDDHYYEFTPKSLTKILEKYGFKKVKIVYTGLHPKRIYNKIPKFLYPLVRFFMKVFGLGDTFEAYYRLLE